jgi:antitoxin component YwqK of YwqJK toxin-antitoxin module
MSSETKTTYYENGQKKDEHILFNKRTWWYENGNLKKEENYKKVKWLRRYWTEILYGSYTEWYENGNLKKEVNYINSSTSDENYKKDKVIEWYENGQKKWEKHLKESGWITIGWDESGMCTFGCD